jgi:signal transduction histidine kinase
VDESPRTNLPLSAQSTDSVQQLNTPWYRVALGRATASAESAIAIRNAALTRWPNTFDIRLGRSSSIPPITDLAARAAQAAAGARVHSLALAPETAPAPSWLSEVEAAFDPFDDHPETAAALAAASSRARTLHAAGGGGQEADRSAALTFAADALAGVMLESVWPHETIADVIGRVALILDAPTASVSLELFVRAASNPHLLELPPLLTIELQLRLLLALSPISEVSLWADETDRQLRCVAHAGDAPPTRRVRTIVRSILDGADEGSSPQRNWIHGVPVLRWQQPHAALVGRAHPNDRLQARALLQEAARCMAPVLEREMLLERSAERERKLAESSERHMMRLGFDLHDGPLQDLAALGMDVELARGEISKRVPVRARRLVSGRLDDLHAQINGLESSLRELAVSLQPASIVDPPLAEVLRREVDKFESRGATRVTLELGGELEGLTTTQRITIYRIVQEGLSNVRDHSEATAVRVTVDGRQGQIRVQIEDDGKGFQVESTMIRAAKNGRLGLVGIGERVRLLGGQFDVNSRPGGPTTLSVSLLRWHPAAAE